MTAQKKTAKLDCANIHYNEHGTPVAEDFDDVYFSNHDGLAESRYVFIEQNKLQQRWQTHEHDTFVIAETGFGTGLNFLAVWHAFDEFRQHHPNAKLRHLHIISTEKYPLAQQDLSNALAQWPQLKSFSAPLIEQYPQPLLGCHRRQFANDSITLDLWLGDVAETLPQVSQRYQGIVDAWFLDGFAPSKNPQMWQPSLYANMARLTKMGGSFATFTAAGAVKRALIEAGFEVKKAPGFGRKRDMLVGELLKPTQLFEEDKLFYRPSALFDRPAKTSSKIAIIGTGMAAAQLAYRFSCRGYPTLLIGSQSQLADGASGNQQGGFYPQLNAESNIASEIQALAFDYACSHYKDLLSKGYDFAHQWCGVLQLAFNEKVAQRQQKLLDNGCWPTSMIHGVNANQASDKAGIELPMSALYIPQGGWISPPELVKALCVAAKDRGGLELQLDCPIDSITPKSEGYRLSNKERHFDADIVIIAAGADASRFQQCAGIPFQPVRGQVEQIPSQSSLQGLKTVLCHKGYLTPHMAGQHALGSTYVKQDVSTEYRVSEQSINQMTIQKALKSCGWAQQLVFNQQGRAAARCTVADHLPVVGSLFDSSVQQSQFAELYKALPMHRYPQAESLPNLFVLSGLGSRGLTTAPLMADLMFSQIVGEPLPLGQTLLDALNPNRFLIRKLIRRL